MKKILCFFVLIFAIFKSNAQDLEFGLLMGGNLYQHTQWDRAIYEAPNSYHTYVENNLGRGLLTKKCGFKRNSFWHFNAN